MHEYKTLWNTTLRVCRANDGLNTALHGSACIIGVAYLKQAVLIAVFKRKY